LLRGPASWPLKPPGGAGGLWVACLPGCHAVPVRTGKQLPSCGMDGGVVFVPGVPGFPPGASWNGDGTDSLLNGSSEPDSQPELCSSGVLSGRSAHHQNVRFGLPGNRARRSDTAATVAPAGMAASALLGRRPESPSPRRRRAAGSTRPRPMASRASWRGPPARASRPAASDAERLGPPPAGAAGRPAGPAAPMAIEARMHVLPRVGKRREGRRGKPGGQPRFPRTNMTQVRCSRPNRLR